MPVDTQHKLFHKYKTQTQKVRDCLEGEEAVKARGTVYLPALSSHLEDGLAGDARYGAYRGRAMFYGAADRTAKGLTGAVMRKDPDIEWPEAGKDLLDSLGQRGESIFEMVADSIEDTVSVGRYGLLVDAPQDADSAPPFVVTYPRESITNWEEETIDGRRVPIRIHLMETREVKDPADEFATVEETIYRVLRLGTPGGGEEGGEPVYYQEIWARSKGPDGGDWDLEETIVPKISGGRTLTEIPMVVINPSKTGMSPEKPPMLDLVNVNLSHYRNSADLEHGRHWTALPTAWASGFPLFDPDTQQPIELRVGSEAAWLTEKENARAGYMEFTGAGLGHLQEGMREKQELMSVLGARLLEESKKGIEAAETVKLRQSGERSVLSRVADTVSEGWTMILKWVAQWASASEVNVGLVLNRDYDVARLTPQELAALVGAMQAGGMSWNSVFWNLKRGEMIPEGIEEDDEARLIMDGPPGFEPPAPAVPDEPEEDEDEDSDDEDEAAA